MNFLSNLFSKANIRLRLLIFLVLTSISSIPVMLLGYWVQQTAVEKEIMAVEEKHLIIAQNLSNAFDRYAIDTKAVFAHISLNIDMIEKLKNVDMLLDSMGISDLCTVDNLDRISAALNKLEPCGFSLDKEKITKLRAKVESYPDKVSISRLRRLDNRPVFFLAQRINADRFAVGTLETSYIRKIQKSIAFGKKGHSMVVDASGRVIAHPNARWEASSKDASKLSVVQKMIRGETGVSTFYSPPMKADMIAGHTTVPDVGWGVMVPQPYSELIEQAGDVRWAAFFVTIFGLFFATLLAWLAARALSNPITRVSETARAIARGDTKVRVTNISRYTAREVRDLANSFNLMVGQLRASHEDLERHRDNLGQLVDERTIELLQQKRNLDITLASIGDAVITTDSDYHIAYLNPVAEKLTGWSLQQANGLALEEVLTFLDVNNGEPMMILPTGHNQANKQPYDSVLKRADGSTIDVQKTVAKIEDDDNSVIGMVIVIRDVTVTRNLSRKLSYEAAHDPLTGLVNRRAFEEKVAEAIVLASSDQSIHSLFYIDLDRFKIVNDSCGHAAGDELLCNVTKLIKLNMRKADTLARLGGDEFGMLLSECPLQKALGIAENIRQLIEDCEFAYKDQVFKIGASIGVIEIDHRAESLKEVFSAADSACYLAKEHGRNRVETINIDNQNPSDE
ncbi:MAG: diguanylate cyclase [Gammaproteobacteria bacterium]|nr:diguanylate cyclase [Gammaproteobacteria bacterium]